jgi:hypothetical protein
MTASLSKDVDGLVAKLGQPHSEIVTGLRKVIKAAAPDIEERIGWGCPVISTTAWSAASCPARPM